MRTDVCTVEVAAGVRAVRRQGIMLATQQAAMNVGRMFKERLMRGLTRKDVATAARVSERAIRKYEEGQSYPTREVYNRLANMFSWDLWEE